MKTSLKLLLGLVGMLLIVGASPSPVRAAVYFDVSSLIVVSSQPAAATQLLAATTSPRADVRLICTQFANAGEFILIQTSSTNFSTSTSTGTARFPCLPSSVQQLDFWINDYRGPLWAITNSTYTIPVNVWRQK